MNRLINIWLAARGHISMDHIKLQESVITQLRERLWDAENEAHTQRNRADLAAKLYNESEAGRKAASDALGDQLIQEMKNRAR